MQNRKTINTLIILFPFLDLITALFTRNSDIFYTPGIIVKGIFMIFMFFYTLKTTSKYKKLAIYSYIFFFIYIFFYFMFKSELLNAKYIFDEVKYLFKLFYFPNIFLGLLCYFDEYHFNKNEMHNIFKISLIIYTILLFIPFILGISYNTYPEKLKGYIGLFYSGNEIANIMILLSPAMYLFIKDKKYTFLVSLLIIYTILTIGTKVATIGILGVSFLAFIYYLLYGNKRGKVISLVLLIFTIILSLNSFAYNNYKYSLKKNYVPKEEIKVDKKKTEEIGEIMRQIDKFYGSSKFNVIFKSLLSSRNVYLANTVSIYKDNKALANTLFGMGFSNTSNIDDENISKLIEIDILDGYFHYGMISLIIMFYPLIVTLVLMIKSKNKMTVFQSYYILMILLGIGISCLSGHTFFSPAVSIYLILYLLLIINESKCFKSIKLKNKVSILSLHMGYGGIERSIVNQANMISKYYDVEIVSLYKISNDISYKLNKNVKLIYLSNIKPNKKEFLDVLHSKDIYKIFKEGFKSLKILYLKKKLVKDYILNTNAKVIISTRYEFTKLLNLYGDSNVKIAEEHVYHNNNKRYINKLYRSLKNIDYLIPASKYLEDDYKRLFKNVNVFYIPQSINDTNDFSKSVNNTVIAVGRLEKEKGFSDLIDVFELVINNNKNARLIIAGDGSLKRDISNRIKKKKLDKYIKLVGFLNDKELISCYKKSSILVMTSYYESFGLVLLEAMSYKIPCIAFDSALGALEIIKDNCGYLIENRDKNKMAYSILNLLNDKNKLKDMGSECYKYSTNYMCSNVEKKWYKFIDKVLGEWNEKNIEKNIQ